MPLSALPCRRQPRRAPRMLARRLQRSMRASCASSATGWPRRKGAPQGPSPRVRPQRLSQTCALVASCLAHVGVCQAFSLPVGHVPKALLMASLHAQAKKREVETLTTALRSARREVVGARWRGHLPCTAAHSWPWSDLVLAHGDRAPVLCRSQPASGSRPPPPRRPSSPPVMRCPRRP